MDDPKKASSIYDFTATDIDGNQVTGRPNRLSVKEEQLKNSNFQVSLDKYKGHVCVIVNVATK
jgi:glutathione peroxidase-family protein